jgi:CheY-like chemotaxis protein
MMPGLNGVELVRKARAIRPDLRVLYVSGYADNALFKDHTVSELVVKKPFKLDHLAQAARAVLGEEGKSRPHA